MSDFGKRYFRGMVVASATCMMAACASSQHANVTNVQPHASAGTSINEYVLVDCLLPGQIRSLGTSMTYLTPRRSVKATQRDCAIRGGEYVLFDRSDYGTALQNLLADARSGDATAQTYVAEIYEKGLGLPGPDYAEAASWYRKAADQGYSPAQTSLGSLYERGLGVQKDKAEALDWYRKATGLSNDRLIFESALRAEREAFQREIALRNRTASALRAQLSAAKAPQVAAAGPAGYPPSDDPRDIEEAIARQIESQRLDAEREAEIRTKKLHALQAIQASETSQKQDGDGKAAQVGKLELSLRQQRDELVDTSRRLVATP